MAPVIDLPIDVILEIARGASLRDILSLTQTCHSLRDSGSKYLWLDASDAATLPLPNGGHEGLSPEELRALAIKAVKISNNLSKDVPTFVSHQLLGPYPLDLGCVKFLPGADWIVIFEPYLARFVHIRTRILHELRVGGTVHHCDFHHGDQDGIYIAVITGDEGRWYFQVLTVCFESDPRKRPYFSSTPSFDYYDHGHPILYPHSSPCFVSIRGDLAVISSTVEIAVVDWKRGTGLKLVVPEQQGHNPKAHLHVFALDMLVVDAVQTDAPWGDLCCVVPLPSRAAFGAIPEASFDDSDEEEVFTWTRIPLDLNPVDRTPRSFPQLDIGALVSQEGAFTTLQYDQLSQHLKYQQFKRVPDNFVLIASQDLVADPEETVLHVSSGSSGTRFLVTLGSKDTIGSQNRIALLQFSHATEADGPSQRSLSTKWSNIELPPGINMEDAIGADFDEFHGRMVVYTWAPEVQIISDLRCDKAIWILDYV